MDALDVELQDLLNRAASEDLDLYELYSLGELSRDDFIARFRARED